MKLDAKLLLDQKQTLSQSQIQFLEILSMDNVALSTFMQKEYLENPILESRSGSDNTSGSEDLLMETAAAEENVIQDYLLSQLKLSLYSPQERMTLSFLINCLEDSGYFTMPLADAARFLNVEETLVSRCLEELRGLEPVGVFAEDLPQCLLRQLEAQQIRDVKLEAIILRHLPDIASGNIGKIARTLKLSTLQIKKYIAIIKTLNPKPLSGFSTEATTYIVPDLIFQKNEKNWEVVLNDHWIGDYSLNTYYLELMKTTTDPELLDFFRTKAQRASYLIKCIEQRRNTLLQLGNLILQKQQGYFESRYPLTPMTMADVAMQMGVHASTVSRCIKGKYLQYPKGSLLLKTLFTASETDSAKAAITQLISSENPDKPLSDQSLVLLLREHGISISRRAVAKYREELGVKSSFERKVL